MRRVLLVFVGPFLAGVLLALALLGLFGSADAMPNYEPEVRQYGALREYRLAHGVRCYTLNETNENGAVSCVWVGGAR